MTPERYSVQILVSQQLYVGLLKAMVEFPILSFRLHVPILGQEVTFLKGKRGRREGSHGHIPSTLGWRATKFVWKS